MTAPPRVDSGTAKLQAEWAARNAEALHAYVAGWASVVDPAELAFQRSRVAGMSKLVPFELAVFGTEAECVGWLRARLGGTAP